MGTPPNAFDRRALPVDAGRQALLPDRSIGRDDADAIALGIIKF